MSFELGTIAVTQGIASIIKSMPDFNKEVIHMLNRYTHGDWGDALPEEDKAANDEALVDGNRILGAYNTSKGKVWIITEADRSATTILLPSEY